MQKKLTVLFMLFFILFSLTGCAEGGYSVNIYSDGRITETFYVDLDQSVLELAGYDYLEVQTLIFNSFSDVRDSLIANFRNSENNLSIMEETAFINSYIRPPSIENSAIGISFLFPNYDNYKLFYDIQDDGEEDNYVEEDKIFYIKRTTTTQTAFRNGDTSSLATGLLEYFSNPANGNEVFTLVDVDFTYSYTTSSSKVSSNADRIYYTASGLKVHEWNVPADNYSMEIEFYEYRIVALWWYVLGLGLTGLFIVSLLIYNKIKQKQAGKVVVTLIKEER